MAGLLGWLSGVGNAIKNTWEDVTPWEEADEKRRKQQAAQQAAQIARPQQTLRIGQAPQQSLTLGSPQNSGQVFNLPKQTPTSYPAAPPSNLLQGSPTLNPQLQKFKQQSNFSTPIQGIQNPGATPLQNNNIGQFNLQRTAIPSQSTLQLSKSTQDQATLDHLYNQNLPNAQKQAHANLGFWGNVNNLINGDQAEKQAEVQARLKAQQQFAAKNGYNNPVAQSYAAKTQDIAQTPNDSAVGGFIHMVGDDLGKAQNTLQVPINAAVGGAAMLGDKIFNGGRNYQQIHDITQAQVNDALEKSFVSPEVASGQANPLQFAGQFTKTGVELAPYFVGVGGPANLTTRFGEVIGSKVASPVVANMTAKVLPHVTNAAIAAPTFAALDAANQGTEAINNGGQTGFNPMQSIQSGAAAGALSLAAPAVAGTTKFVGQVGDVATGRVRQAYRAQVLKAATDKTKVIKVPTATLTSLEGAPDRVRVEQYKAAIQSGQPVEPLIIMKSKDGTLGVEDGKHRLQAYKELGVNSVPVKVATPAGIRKITQGGYVKVPSLGDEASGSGTKGTSKQTTPASSSGQTPDLSSNRQISVSSSKNSIAPTDASQLKAAYDKMEAAFAKINDKAAKNEPIYGKEMNEANRLADEYHKLRDSVESKKLKPQTPRTVSEEQYLVENNAPFMDGSEPALHRNRIQTKRGQNDAVARTMDAMTKNNQKRGELRVEYNDKVAKGELKAPSLIERSLQRAHGHPDLQSTQAARRILAKQGIDWKTGKPVAAKMKTSEMAARVSLESTGRLDSLAQPSRELGNLPNQKKIDSSAGQQTKTSNQISKGTQTSKARESASSSYINTTPTEFSAKDYVKQQTKAQNIASKDLNGSRFEKFKSNVKSKLLDDLSPIEDVLNRSLKKNGIQLKPSEHISQQLDRTIRADTISHQYMKDKGFDKIVQSVKDPKAFDQYLIARHATDLERKGINTGRDIAKDKALMKQLAPEYEKHAQAVTAYTRQMLDTAVDYGLISKDVASALKKEYPNYVPLNRVFSDAEKDARYSGPSGGYASKSTQKVVQRIKGSSREIESPLGSIIEKTQDLIKEGEQNRSARMLAEYRKLADNPFELRELAPNETVGTKSTISYLDHGRVRRFETTPEVAAAAKAMNRQQVNVLLRILRVPTRILRLGATGVNSGFALANLVKDMASAAINSNHPLRSTLDLKVVGKALDAAFHHRGKNYDEFIRAGGGGTRWDIARDEAARNVKSIRAEKNHLTKARYNLNPLNGQYLRTLENTIGRTEELTRAMQYFGNKKAALNRGLSEAESSVIGADAARSNTVNFARHGEYGEVLNSVLPYLNAGIQGSRTFLRNVKSRPVQTLAKVAILSTVPVVTVTAWNLSDPKRKAAYNDISDYEKENNIIIVPPNPTKDPKTGKWNVIKIPVSQEIANLNNIARNVVESAAGNKDFSVKDTLGDLVGTATSLNVQTPRQAVGQLTPQALKPGIEALTNQNLFTGNQIVPDSQKNLPAADQYGNYTSQTAKSLGKLTNLSPRQIDNFFRTTTGGAGQTVLHYTDKILGAGDSARGTSLPESITNRFYGASSKPTSDVIEKKYNDLKQKVIDSPEYKKASQYDKSRMLNRLQNDVSAVEYNADGFGSGKLTKKQESLKSNGFDVSTYTNLDSGSGSSISINSSISKDAKSTLDKWNSMDTKQRQQWFRTENDAQYQYMLAKYQNDKAEGSISSIQDITRSRDIAKAKVGSNFSKDTRDLYGLSKTQIESYLNRSKNSDKIVDQLLKYDQALVDAGIIKKPKFGASSVRKGKGRSHAKTSSANLISQIQKAQNSAKTKYAAPRFSAPVRDNASLPQVAIKKYTANKARISHRRGVV